MGLPNLYIGVDPGAKGAICLLCPEKNLTLFEDTVASPAELLRELKAFKVNYNVVTIMMEKVSSVPGTSAGSNFKFGYNVGHIEAILRCTELGLDFVRPKAWQKELGVTSKFKGAAIKKEVARLITGVYPQAEIYGPRGGLQDGRSDALAVAHYARIKYPMK